MFLWINFEAKVSNLGVRAPTRGHKRNLKGSQGEEPDKILYLCYMKLCLWVVFDIFCTLNIKLKPEDGWFSLE